MKPIAPEEAGLSSSRLGRIGTLMQGYVDEGRLPGHGCGFGLGFRVVVNATEAGLPTSEGEYGWGGAASTSFLVEPKEGLIGLLLTQLMPSRTYPIRDQFKVLVYQALVE
ncbi:hypothetical protein ACFLTC_03505 [Chloroflexota bacterium]